MYLGIWIDVGLVGLITFLWLMAYQAWRICRLRLNPTDRWGVFSLLFLVLIDSFVKHTMFFNAEGWAAYSLLFILPTSASLLHHLPASDQGRGPF